MNDIKVELAKKKAQLAELKRRKREREQEKISKTENSTQTSTFSYNNNLLSISKSSSSNNFDIIQTFSGTKSLGGGKANGHHPLKEFENLNVDEIMSKCGLNETNNNQNQKYSSLNKNPTVTSNNTTSSNSSVSISLSSSSQSFKSSAILNGFREFSMMRDKSHFDDLDNSTIDNEESISKKIEDLNLTTDLNPNQIINIYPNVPITYTKETQTVNSYDFPATQSSDIDSDPNSESAEPKLKRNKQNRKRHKKDDNGKHNKEEPYDNIFIYDTLQWEDEYEFNPDEIDINKQLNLDSLNLLETQLNLNENFLINDSSNNRLIAGINNLDITDDDELVQEASNLQLSPDHQRVKYVHTEEKLARFLIKKRPIIERCLNQNFRNIFFDYAATSLNENTDNESNRTLIKLKKTFTSPTSSVVTCLDWSLHNPDLLLCSYDNMSFNYEEAATESVAVIWNARKDQKVAQQTFTCTSLITSCCFASFNSNLIIAGTYSGQMVVWDIRCNRPTPIQRSALSVSAHLNPVYCVKAIENKDSNVISISNDGKMCTWSLENLNLPVETHELYIKNTNRNVYATCLDFQTVLNENLTNETIKHSNEFSYVPKTFSKFTQFAVVGAEDGLVHTLAKTNNKLSPYDSFTDHFGPVTSVSCYNQCKPEFNDYSYQTNESLSQLFLSSSFDSTIKLWNSMDNSGPIHTFECNGDYVYDVCWSPIHPAIFASVDGSGKLDIWNLNKDTEVPSASIDVDNGTCALNKLKWSRKGTEIAVGDDHGNISIFEINDNFARPGPDETRQFLNTIDGLKQLNYEMGKTDTLNYLVESFR